MTDVLMILGGLIGLFLGGEMLVRGAVALARTLGLSPMVIGLTIVGFGTSSPELVTSLQAAFAGSPGIAIGNVVGSNIANILLILGIAAMLSPIAISPPALARDGSVLVLATLVAAGIILTGALGRAAGGAMVAALIMYVGYTIRLERRAATAATPVYTGEAALVAEIARGLGRPVLITLAGLAVTILAARLLVDGSIVVAGRLGLSEAVIGLTVVAIGTSMPELVTSIVAARKGESDVAVGNVIGSNIFNILGILGMTSMVHPMVVPESIAHFDVWVMLAATVALVVAARTGWRVRRGEGAVLALGYLAYVALLTTWAGSST